MTTAEIEGELTLGSTEDGRSLALPVGTLLRHAMALGASGSGKTVFCKVVVEEAVRLGIPALVIDPQGDLCGLAEPNPDADDLAAHGLDPAIGEELAHKAEVVVFTPGSRRGVPLCADPVDPALADLDDAERLHAVSRTAAVVVGLLGYDVDSDDGAGLAAVVDRALHELLTAGARPSLAALTEHLFAAQEADDFARYARYLDARKLRTAGQRLARLDVGARRALFHDGVPIDIDVLLGLDPRAPTAEGRTRVAVVYLNTLHSQEDKDFFVAALADRLYAWMLAHPSPEPQALFYIDEVAPFIPPVRKPACKDGLSLLFKQARKYGLCCLMATQNPGDVDYRAMAQFGTWALGRLTTRQDLKKVEPTVKSLAPDDTDRILGTLPALKPGQMVLISPDRLDAPTQLQTRWLATLHETWNEDRVERYSEAHRARFAQLVSEPKSTAPVVVEETVEPADSVAPTLAPPPMPEAASPDVSSSLLEDAPELEDLASFDDSPEEATVLSGSHAIDTRALGILGLLARVPSATIKELATNLSRSEAAVRRDVARLVSSGDLHRFKVGRAQRYFSSKSGGRPDLGLPNPVEAIQARVDEASATEIGHVYARSKVLGMIGEDETFERSELAHRLVFKLDFEEKVERSLLGRLFGQDSHDERLGSVYLHADNLGVLVYEEERGIRFVDVPNGPASEIRDFDGVVERERRPPGSLAIDDEDVRRRRTVDEVRKSFESRFDARPGEITPLFVPLHVLFFRTEKGSLRRLMIDAIAGRPVRWL